MSDTNNNQDKKKECACKEMTCRTGCTRNHTHKTFFCDKCEPEACKHVYYKSIPTPPVSEWEKKDYEKVGGKIHKILNATMERKLTFKEYEDVIKLIGSVFSISQATKQAYNQGKQEALEWVMSELSKKKKSWAGVMNYKYIHEFVDYQDIKALIKEQ